MRPAPERPEDLARRPATPALDALLERVRRRLTTLVWLHGLGTAALCAAAWLGFCFLADWALHLPAPVRAFHLLVLVLLPAVLLVRHLARPLRRVPDRTGLAVLVERAHPRCSELLVTAVDLGSQRASGADPECVARVLRDADEAAGRVELARVLAPVGPRRRALLGALGVTAVAGLMAWNAAAAEVFLARIAGGSTPWPQRTHLALEIPLALPGAAPAPAATSGELVVRVARGSDVPVVVRADGVVPEEVVLHFEGGERSVLSGSGGPVFRTLLRSVQQDVAFHATGGDDRDEDPRVRLVVLQPPDLAGVAVRIEPPAYSGLPARLELDRDVEVLAGSLVTVHARTVPPGIGGRARLLPEDRLVDLTATPFPLSDSEAAAGAIAGDGLAFTLRAERSLRYRFELLDDQGLANPDPGLFGITVVEDRAPEVELVSPGRGDFDTVPAGLVPLRVRAQDDFEIARVGYEVTAPGSEPGSGTWRELELRLLTAEERAAGGERTSGPRAASSSDSRAAGTVAVARARLEVAALAPEQGAKEGLQLQLVARALDDAEPTAHEGRSAALRVRIVTPEEFLRRIQDRLARAQSSASALLDLQREKRRATLELLASIQSDAPGGESTAGEVAAVLTGERRVQGDARSLARELCGAAEAVLYARVDERAGAALEILDRAQADAPSRGFDPEPWHALARAAGLGDAAGAGLAGKLVDLAILALAIEEEHVARAVEALARAQDAADLPQVERDLVAAAREQEIVLERLEKLLERLAEWDNFQSVLGLTRDILNGQKGLSERTRQSAKDK